MNLPIIEPTFSGWIYVGENPSRLKKVTADRESNASAQEQLTEYIKSRNLFGHIGYILKETISFESVANIKVTTVVETNLEPD